MRFLLLLPRLKKQLICAALDGVFLPLTFVLAITARYEGFSAALFSQYFWLIAAVPFVSVPIFIRIGLYHAVLRHIGQRFVSVVLFGVTLSVLCLGFVGAMAHATALSRAVFFIYWTCAVLYVGISRFIARIYLTGIDRNDDAVKIVIYGAGRAGVQLATALRASDEYACVGYLDDNPSLHGSSIAGVKVIAPERLGELVRLYDVKEVLLAMPTMSKGRQKQIIDRLEPHKLRVRVTPSISSLITGELRVQDVRDIEIEDLLGRDPVLPDPRLLALCITGKNVLVTGAGGSIGAELCRQIVRQHPARLVLFEVSEFALYAIEQELLALRESLRGQCELVAVLGTTTDRARIESVLCSMRIHTVYHAAAYKHVPLVERNPIEGIRNNVFGTLHLARAAMAAKVEQFVLISSDKAVRPCNVMGATKRLSELILQACARAPQSTRFCMVRFGNVLDSSGSVVPLFRKQIMQGGPITLTHPDITRYFMTVAEAAQLVLQAGSMGQGGDVFVLDMGEPVRIADLARRMVRLSGLELLSEANPDGTIAIEHVGLRPGEKLFEELLIGGDVEGTSHPLIMRAKEAAMPWAWLDPLLKRLDRACAGDHLEVRAVLRQLVPEYAPQCGIEDIVWLADGAAEERAVSTPTPTPVSIPPKPLCVAHPERVAVNQTRRARQRSR